MYYLQSRYYDPAICRFINADSHASTGQGILGHNMYAYCGNNPSTAADKGGNAWCKIDFDAFNPFDSSIVPLIGGGGGYSGAVQIMDSTESKIAQDIDDAVDFITNTSEANVLNAEHIAFYKGTLFIKVPFMDTSGFSLGVVFLGSNVKDPNTVRHEYGHTVQLKHLGVGGYLRFIVLPSMYYYHKTIRGVYSWDDYYNRPWEFTADMFGGVTWGHDPTAQDSAWKYYYFAIIYSRTQ